MGKLLLIIASVLTVCLLLSVNSKQTRYQPNWDSLDSRPLPAWFDEAKFGIFIVWGVYSVPSWSTLHTGSAGEWFWWYWNGIKNPQYVQFMEMNYPPGFTYQDFASQFKAEFYDPNQWADIIKASGAKYVVFTTKHHDGFTLWPSKRSWGWNSVDVGPNRDLTGELAEALRNRTDIHVGLYHSQFEWFNPLYLQDKSGSFKTQKFVQEKTGPELYELVNNYKPDIIWSDGDWEASYTYWNSTNFLAWLYNESPVKDKVVVNDRWGKETHCKHGDFYSCSDRYNPGVLQKHKWENAMTIDRYSWGYRRNANLSDYLSINDLLKTLAQTVSCGGNLLMDIGPTGDGRIMPIFEERLRQMGEWLEVNGEAIYGTTPWAVAQHDSVSDFVWYTLKKETPPYGTVYGIMLEWPKTTNLTLGAFNPSKELKVQMLGYPGYLEYIPHFGGWAIEVQVPDIPVDQLQSKWAWVLKMTGVDITNSTY